MTIGDAVANVSSSSPASIDADPGDTSVPATVVDVDVPGTSEALGITGLTVTVGEVAPGPAGIAPAALEDNVEQAIAALEVYAADGSGNPTGPALASTSDIHGGPIALNFNEVSVASGDSASLVVTVDLADNLSSVGFGLALALLAPLALFGLFRRRRLSALLVAAALALVLASCTPAAPPVQVSFSVEVTAIEASSGVFDVSTNGLPVEGAEVNVSY